MGFRYAYLGAYRWEQGKGIRHLAANQPQEQANIVTYVEDLQRFMDEQYEWLCTLDERITNIPCPAVKTPFREDESRGFLRGNEAGLFQLKPSATQGGFVELAYSGVFGDSSQHFFGTADKQTGERLLQREAVCQWAAACDLVLDFGWPAGAIRVESEGFSFLREPAADRKSLGDKGGHAAPRRRAQIRSRPFWGEDRSVRAPDVND